MGEEEIVNEEEDAMQLHPVLVFSEETEEWLKKKEVQQVDTRLLSYCLRKVQHCSIPAICPYSFMAKGYIVKRECANIRGNCGSKG